MRTIQTVYVIGQIPIQLRYQEWFNTVITDGLYRHIKNVRSVVTSQFGEFDHIQEPKAGPASSNFFDTILPAAMQYEVWQMSKVLSQVQPQDVILCLDASLPGVCGYIAATNKPCKMAAIVHGSSFNHLDIFPVTRRRLESETICAFDKLFVASDYHKEKLELFTDTRNVVNLGWLPSNPALLEFSPNKRRKAGSVCSVSRNTPQKRNLQLEKEFTQLTGVTVDVPEQPFQTWKEYYSFLRDHEYLLVTAQEETFGYPIQEAMYLETKPLVPDYLCYPEFVHKDLQYDVDNVNSLVTRYHANLGIGYGYEDPKSKDEQFFKTLAKELLSL